MKRAGWQRESAPGDKCRAFWRHRHSGWCVRHCGHMTALWPYYAIDPAHPASTVVTHNGKGFQTLAIAIETVEAIIAGDVTVTTENCVPGVRRVLPRR